MTHSKNNKAGTIAVLGSAFNPPHAGHADVVEQALEYAGQVLLVPSYCHAFGKQMAPYDKRLLMTRAMAASLSNRGDVQVSNIEQTLSEGKGSGQAIYTYDVLSALQEHNPQASLIFVLGPDNAEPEVWRKFYRAQDIVERWGLFKAKERLAVRSTGIRAKLAKGEMPTESECPASVIEALKINNCYKKVNTNE